MLPGRAALARITEDHLVTAVARADRAAEHKNRDGSLVRYLWSLLIPQDARRIEEEKEEA